MNSCGCNSSVFTKRCSLKKQFCKQQRLDCKRLNVKRGETQIRAQLQFIKSKNKKFGHDEETVEDVLLGMVKINQSSGAQVTSLLSRCGQPRQVLGVVKKFQEDFNGINISTAAVVLGHSFERNYIWRAQTQEAIEAYRILLPLIKTNITQLKARSVANCLWSLGKGAQCVEAHRVLREEFYEVFTILSKKSVKVKQHLTAEHLASIFWAMAKVNYKSFQEFGDLVVQAQAIDTQGYGPQEISNTLWAMATLRYKTGPHIQFFLDKAQHQIQKFTSQGVANVLWSLRKLRYLDEKFMTTVETMTVNGHWYDFTAQHISNMALSYADLGVNDLKVLEKLVHRFKKCKSISLQSASNLLYALAVSKAPIEFMEPVLDILVMEAQGQGYDQLKGEELVMIRKAQILTNRSLMIPPDLEALTVESQKKWVQQKIQFPNSFLDEVQSTLSVVFPQVDKFVISENGELDIHLMVFGEKGAIAVQVLAHNAFISNKREILLGSCKRHLEMMQFLGYRLIYISAYKWTSPKYQDQTIKQLQALLKN